MLTATLPPLTSDQLAVARTDAGTAGQLARTTAALASLVDSYLSAEAAVAARRVLVCAEEDILEAQEEMWRLGRLITELRDDLANLGQLPSRAQATSYAQRESWVWAGIEQEIEDWNQTLETSRPEVYREY